jgi:hypothetical protein
MSKHNLDLLIEAARLLKPLLGELVFVGGSTTALLITDKEQAGQAIRQASSRRLGHEIFGHYGFASGSKAISRHN